ncbi:MAG: hypothetical protein F9K29_19800 [Hyphomicrobiaceae bacterium]|nr:MAG: hypothetical protein F9K29_19800 [Hyphomicrobiaceae bacterium]
MQASRIARWPPALAGILCISAPAAGALENPADIIAAHIRQQGYACNDALQAIRSRRASRPNQAAWILRCDNATYRVRLIPDMAAHVEVVK